MKVAIEAPRSAARRRNGAAGQSGKTREARVVGGAL